MTLYDRIKKIADIKKLSISSIEEAAKISNGSISKWKQNIPKADNLYKVAKFLNCSMEFLLFGLYDNQYDEYNNINNLEYNIIESNDNYAELFNENEIEILNLLHKFNDKRNQIKFIARAEDVANEMLLGIEKELN